MYTRTVVYVIRQVAHALFALTRIESNWISPRINPCRHGISIFESLISYHVLNLPTVCISQHRVDCAHDDMHEHEQKSKSQLYASM